MPEYCPVCARYSDKFPTAAARDAHIIDVHALSPEALDLTRRKNAPYGVVPTGKATKEG